MTDAILLDEVTLSVALESQSQRRKTLSETNERHPPTFEPPSSTRARRSSTSKRGPVTRTTKSVTRSRSHSRRGDRREHHTDDTPSFVRVAA
jgi:hypothetical protein